MSRRILITGAQGFLGRFLVAHWIRESEHELVGVGRSRGNTSSFTHDVHWGDRRMAAPLPPELREPLTDDRYRYVPLDLRDQAGVAKLLQEFRPDVVVHLAAALRGDPPQKLTNINIGATVALLEAIAAAGIEPPLTVLGSTGGIYGVPEAVPIPETAGCAPIDPYSASKLAAEHFARTLAQRHTIPALWARIFNVVGPGQDERHVCGRIAQQLAAIRAGLLEPTLRLGRTDSTRDFVDVRDVASALAVLTEHGEPGEAYNVGSGEETQVETVVQHLLRAAELTDEVAILRQQDRPSDIPRHYADIGRLRELGGPGGFAIAHPLAESLGDVLHYYEDRVARSQGAEEARHDREFTVQVDRAHRYDVVVRPGIVDAVPARLHAMFPGQRMVVLTDDVVHEIHGRGFVEKMTAASIPVSTVVVPSGEDSKSLERYRTVLEQLRDARLDRRSVLVCFGGGLISDLGGFAAATYMRGVAYVNVPTTLIAQHDAAIGGKVAVNMPWAKNYVGAFHHPRAVFADPELLATLDARNLAAGVAEAIKVAICGEPHLFELLESSAEAIGERRDAQVLAEVVGRAAERKVALLAPDPYEVDLRRVLNLGHTVGHALETELAYEGILHGEAVGFGIAAATAVALNRARCPAHEAERIFTLLARHGLPPRIERRRLMACRRHLQALRMVRGQKLHFVIPTSATSTAFLPELDDDDVLQAIDTLASHPRLGTCIVEEQTA